jgi:hypothetical protein
VKQIDASKFARKLIPWRSGHHAAEQILVEKIACPERKCTCLASSKNLQNKGHGMAWTCHGLAKQPCELDQVNKKIAVVSDLRGSKNTT